ncbi:MAG: hypothetical protein Q9191_005191 [Dirinaria sp. TL-2023a]
MERFWRPPSEEEKLENPVRVLSPNQMFAEYQRRQLRPGEKLDIIAEKMVKQVSDLLQWQNLNLDQPDVVERSASQQNLSLISWTTQTFIRTTTEVYWGGKLFEIEPELLHTYRIWENTAWKYVFQIPQLFSRDMYQARDKLVNAFTAYFKLAQAERKDVAWFVPTAEAEMRDIGLDESDLGRAHMLQHWALNGNMPKVSFWIMAHLLHDPALLEAVRDETAPGVVDDSPKIPYLLDNCPRLEAVYHEVLRLQMSNSLMRQVIKPTRIGGKVLQENRNVLIPYRVLHYDQQVWGANAATFDANRFLGRKRLARDPNYRPFGGGQHMCPGRFLAKQAIFAFVALTLSRYELCIQSHGRDGRSQHNFPRVEDFKPGLGTLGPRKGDDVIVRCTLRAQVQ